MGALAQARFRHRYFTLRAVWRQAQNHRGSRRASGDRAHSHALGVGSAAAASRAGAAVGSVSGGLSCPFALVLAGAGGFARARLAKSPDAVEKSARWGRNFGGAWRKITRLTVRWARDRLRIGEKGGSKFYTQGAYAYFAQNGIHMRDWRIGCDLIRSGVRAAEVSIQAHTHRGAAMTKPMTVLTR